MLHWSTLSITTLLFPLKDVCSQARETRTEFGRQRSSLGAIQTRMVGVLSP